MDEFLQKMGELFECVLFTASLAKVFSTIFLLNDNHVLRHYTRGKLLYTLKINSLIEAFKAEILAYVTSNIEFFMIIVDDFCDVTEFTGRQLELCLLLYLLRNMRYPFQGRVEMSWIFECMCDVWR